MLSNVVNLVKYDVFIFLVVVMFFQAEFWSLFVTLVEREFKLKNVSVIICDVHTVNIILKLLFKFPSLR
jgi:hypothetical protein